MICIYFRVKKGKTKKDKEKVRSLITHSLTLTLFYFTYTLFYQLLTIFYHLSVSAQYQLHFQVTAKSSKKPKAIVKPHVAKQGVS